MGSEVTQAARAAMAAWRMTWLLLPNAANMGLMVSGVDWPNTPTAAMALRRWRME